MKKTIHYRRVEWFNRQQTDSVVTFIREVLNVRPHIENTRFAIAHEICELRHRDDLGDKICLHISTHVAGARKGVSPQAQGVVNSDLADAPAPAGAEFTEREVALVISEDAVAFVSQGNVHPQFVERAIRGVLALEHPAEITSRFAVAARADPAKVQQLLEEGVHFLDLGLTLDHAEAIQQIEGQPQSLQSYIGSVITEAISARFHEDLTEEEIGDLTTANAHLVLNFRKSAPLEKIEGLTTLATEAIEGEEDFKIKTRKGNSFSRDQLLLRGNYTQPGPSSTLSYVLAWQNATNFLNVIQ
ncbi:MAG TPA: hypothetical protein VGV39_19775 [Mesorhizobium sp.]|jgi:hypothetical protein|uniref:hypothetical protein n=1 Tax=Mesorhizobium sp. TaxID=1871066 RepID=UPI002DDCB448|nr:hypothetical protein [Mesorhizobium sp.]HEV2505326.1 hypothetical protein [Mesorhizobium sp.]